MKPFKEFYKQALERKGGQKVLDTLLPPVLNEAQLSAIDDGRYLSMMAKCINQAGFHWQVIEKKWPQFEEAFYGFNPTYLAMLPDENWEAYMLDTRVVRNWQKIEAVKRNAVFVHQVAQEHGSFAQFVAQWPLNDQFGLTQYLKKHGSRLGGMTGSYFLRRMGRDTYLLSHDVCVALQQAGLDIPQQPTSQKDLKTIQHQFNEWHLESGLPYAHLSKILAYTTGQNHEAELIAQYIVQDSM